MTKLVFLIYSDELRHGDGTENDPVRRVAQLHTLDGKLMMEHDPYDPQQRTFNDSVIHFP